jgi:hypothetical protein
VKQFLDWSSRNCMQSNPRKCKELVIRKKGITELLPLVLGIPPEPEFRSHTSIYRACEQATLQEDGRFTTHVYNKQGRPEGLASGGMFS